MPSKEECAAVILKHWGGSRWEVHTLMVGPGVFVPEYPPVGPPGYTPVVYVLGTGCEYPDIAALEKFLRVNPNAPLPALAVDVPTEYAAIINSIAQGRHERCQALVATVRAGAPAYGFVWHTSRYTTVLRHVARDCSEALCELGYGSGVVMEAEGDTDSSLAMLAYLADHRPAAGVAINYTRNSLYHPDMVHVCWIQDEMAHLATLASVAAMAKQDRVFACSSLMQQKYTALGYPDVGLLPFGYAASRFRYEFVGEPEQKVAIISNLANPYAPEHGAINDWLVANENTYGLDKERATSQVIASLRLRTARPERAQLEGYIWQVLRHQNILRWADELKRRGIPFTVYGEGWGETEFVSTWAGSVSPVDLPVVYRKHLAVLGVQPNLLLHPRVLECYASGGICLQQADAESPEERLRNAVYWDSADSLMDAIVRLTASPRREEVSVAVQSELVDHSYTARMQQLAAALGYGVLEK